LTKNNIIFVISEADLPLEHILKPKENFFQLGVATPILGVEDRQKNNNISVISGADLPLEHILKPKEKIFYLGVATPILRVKYRQKIISYS
jgi:hypothetical protein